MKAIPTKEPGFRMWNNSKVFSSFLLPPSRRTGPVLRDRDPAHFMVRDSLQKSCTCHLIKFSQSWELKQANNGVSICKWRNQGSQRLRDRSTGPKSLESYGANWEENLDLWTPSPACSPHPVPLIITHHLTALWGGDRALLWLPPVRKSPVTHQEKGRVCGCGLRCSGGRPAAWLGPRSALPGHGCILLDVP